MAHGEHPSIYARRRIVALAAGVAVLAAAGAFLIARAVGGDDTPRVSGAPKDVVAAVQAFGQALAARDFAAICDHMFTVEAREAAGGDSCRATLAQSAAGVRDPRISIRAVTVRGDQATATVVARQRGKRDAVDVIELQRERGRYRIAAAGGAGER
jgi:ketosteroid isomerase-like protein